MKIKVTRKTVTLPDNVSAARILEYIDNNPDNLEFNLDTMRELAGKVDISAAANADATILYSGGVGNTYSGDIAVGMAKQHPNLGVIDNTEAYKLFNDPIFERTLTSAVTKANPNVPTSQIENLVKEALGGTDRSMWSIASEKLATNVKGDVAVVISPDVNLNRVFARNELPKLLDNPNVKTINGIDKFHLYDIYTDPNQGLVGAMDHLTITGGSMLTTLKEGTYQGTKVYDTKGFLKVLGIEGKRLPLLTTDVQRYSKLFAPGKDYHEWLNYIKPGTSNSVAIKGALTRLGIAGDVLAVTMVATDAHAAYQNGDIQGAADIIAKWGVGFAGGAATGAWTAAMTAKLIAPYVLRFGTPGIVVGGVITLAAGIYGGIYGEKAFLEIYEFGKDMELYVDEKVNALMGDFKESMFGQFLIDALAIGDTHNLARDRSLNRTRPSVLYDDQQPGRKVGVRGIGVNDTFEIQVEQQSLPWNRQVSANTAVAMALANSTLQISLQPRDVICSTDGNDNIYASDTTNNLIYGGKDLGSVGFSSNGNVVLTGKGGNTSPSVGYFIENTTAPYYNETVPIYGGVLWADVRNTPLGASFNVSADLPLDKLGYFMVPGSAGSIPNLRDGVNVTFQKEWADYGSYQQWAPAINGTPISPYCQGWGGGSGSNVRAIYSDIAFNNPNFGTYSYDSGTHYFRACFTTVTLQENITQTLVFPNYGDTITCGLKSDTIGYRMGDGVKRIRNFNASQDNVLIHGGTAQNVKLLPVPEGIFIRASRVNKGVFNETVPVYRQAA